MSDYTKSTNFTAKDALSTGNPAKVIKGSEIDTEFDAIATASATKADKTGNNTFTGDNTFSGTNTHSGSETFTGTITASSAVFQGGTIFKAEGATADDFETSFAVTDPTADRTITFPDSTGTVALTSDISSNVNCYQATSTSDDSLSAGNNTLASFGTVTIPTKGLIKLFWTGRINETSTSNNLIGFGIVIGGSYFYPKYDDNGSVKEGSGNGTQQLLITGSEYRIIYGSGLGDAGGTSNANMAVIDIESTGVTTGSQTVAFAMDALGTATLKGTTNTSRFFMTIEDYS